MLGTIIMVTLAAFFTWALIGGATEKLLNPGTSPSTAYFICVILVLATSLFLGIFWNIPNQSSGETAIRTLAVLLAPALLGVWTAFRQRKT